MSGSGSTRHGRDENQTKAQQDGKSGIWCAVAVGAIAAVGTYFLGKSHGSVVHESPDRRPCARTTRTPRSPAPVRRFSEAEEQAFSAESSRNCSICFNSFDFVSDRGEHIHVTPCGHMFCHYCIYNSLIRCERCPICRNSVGVDETIRVHL